MSNTKTNEYGVFLFVGGAVLGSVVAAGATVVLFQYYVATRQQPSRKSFRHKERRKSSQQTPSLLSYIRRKRKKNTPNPKHQEQQEAQIIISQQDEKYRFSLHENQERQELLQQQHIMHGTQPPTPIFYSQNVSVMDKLGELRRGDDDISVQYQDDRRDSLTGASSVERRDTITSSIHGPVHFPALGPSDRANTAAFNLMQNLVSSPGERQLHHNNVEMNASKHRETVQSLNVWCGDQTQQQGNGLQIGRHHALLEEGEEDYCRVLTPEMTLSEEAEEVCQSLLDCIALRDKWQFRNHVSPDEMPPGEEAAVPSELHPDPFQFDPQPKINFHYEMVNGVVWVFEDGSKQNVLFRPVASSSEFFTDMHKLLKVQSHGPAKSFCHHRLLLLEHKFGLHLMMNADKEFVAQKTAPHRDFYNVRKVDTHIHHSACMHQKHLLRFIKAKLRKEPDEVVIFRDGKYLTLKEVFESLQLSTYDLNVDTLDMHVDKNTFHRFDRFNLKYNPCGQSRLREVFLKNDNLIRGRFLGELTKEVLVDLESNKYQHTEMRISIYGRKQLEWDILAAWVCNFKLASDNNVWLIQIPRLYNVYYQQGLLENFQQMLDNIFLPLFEVTLDPSSHPQLHIFLKLVVGFDSVDDESKPERRPTKSSNPSPTDWNHQYNPAYSYYLYYFYANLHVLNQLRQYRGMNTFAFRPHCGESGDTDHLASAFMTAENIAHGCNLRKSPCLQYLYYMCQVGLCMSPLSNNSLFLDYHKNPFPQYFARGLSISLSSDDPVQIHLTREPLVEEYSVAAQVWKLSSTDISEIARNSVLHSGFPHACKLHWVANKYWLLGPEGNDIKKTNVPNLRMRYRHDTLMEEWRILAQGARNYMARLAALAEKAESP